LKKHYQSITIAEKLDGQWNRALTLKEIGTIEKFQGLSGAEEKIAEANHYLDQVKKDTAAIDWIMLGSVSKTNSRTNIYRRPSDVPMFNIGLIIFVHAGPIAHRKITSYIGLGRSFNPSARNSTDQQPESRLAHPTAWQSKPWAKPEHGANKPPKRPLCQMPFASAISTVFAGMLN